jgi:succinyl-CoA synthetase beta subunit
MNLHEYQAKALFRDAGIAVPDGQMATTPEQAAEIAENLGGSVWVVKAQVHAGGRGKAGGVKVVKSIGDVAAAAKGMLGGELKTKQTGDSGLPINSVIVEKGSSIVSELYISALVDRGQECVIFMASSEGGMDIEEVADKTPEKIITVAVDVAGGIQDWHGRRIGFGIGLEKAQIAQFNKIVKGLYSLVVDKDAALIEINPLITTDSGELVALDGKIGLDENALYRHPELAAMRDPTQENQREYEAAQHDLNYIELDGDIGCMVNGAGLAMATMDVVKKSGGEPANFLDVGGGTTAARVSEAFKLILSGSEIRAILVNIFGGIVRCDLVAEGIIQAVKEVGVKVPVVVRLEGTNVERGRELLASSGLAIITADDLNDAAQKVVAAAKG